jgi:tyrosyl-tRNA synthetase
MNAPSFQSDFIRTLHDRGFIHQGTDLSGLDERAHSSVITGYIGFDATAPSLHAGSLVQIMMLYWMQKCGHKPIVLMGGGTTKIGDPSGKDQARQMLDDDAINQNLSGIQTIFSRFLTFGDGETDAIMVNNDDWLSQYHYIDFLRQFGPHFTINRMLTFDSVKMRLEREQPLSFLEFNYMLMQAVDFRELYQRHGCVLQMGGSDQWGNIVNGTELIRRMAAANDEVASAFGLTTPLLVTSSGAKMGKTAKGAVWLNAEQLSAYDYWQYWRNCEDADIGRFLRLFTPLPINEIERLEILQGSEINEAKKILADETTKMVHGREQAAQARETAQDVFEKGALGTELPRVSIPRAELSEGIMLAALTTRAGLTSSNGEARRLAQGGGLSVNQSPWLDANALVGLDQVNDQGVIRLGKGKKSIILIDPI